MNNYDNWNHVTTEDIEQDLKTARAEHSSLVADLVYLYNDPTDHSLEINTKENSIQKRVIEIELFKALLKWRDDPDHTFVKVCPFCGVESRVTVKCNQYMDWKGGTLIQNAFPSMSASDRELLMTGICDSCWEATCG